MVCRNDLITKFGDSLVELRKLHWWLHNHHVTVFLQQRIPRYAISFERRMRTARIAPIYVDTLDVNSCWETFAAYWLKAGRIFNSTPERPIVAQDMESAKAEILTKLYPASERLDGS
jgi:hypothetical protein